MKIKIALLTFTACSVLGFALIALIFLNKNFEHGFVTSCSERNLPEAACRCLYTEIQKKHSIITMTKSNITGFSEKAVKKAALACKL